MNECLELVVIAALFVGTHLGISSTPLRGLLVSKMGEKPYTGLYSLLSLVLISWLVSTYNKLGDPAFLWPPNPWLHWLPVLLMPVVLTLLVHGLFKPNPSLPGAGALLQEDDLVQNVMRITRHPIQWGICLWALAHLLAAGDIASVIFFGSFALLAGGGTLLIDRKKQATLGDKWRDFSSQTSNVPFVAILQGRQRLVVSEFSFKLTLLAIALYVLLWWGHSWLSLGNMLVNPFA